VLPSVARVRVPCSTTKGFGTSQHAGVLVPSKVAWVSVPYHEGLGAIQHAGVLIPSSVARCRCHPARRVFWHHSVCRGFGTIKHDRELLPFPYEGGFSIIYLDQGFGTSQLFQGFGTAYHLQRFCGYRSGPCVASRFAEKLGKIFMGKQEEVPAADALKLSVKEQNQKQSG
jgi:hypothetical protein